MLLDEALTRRIIGAFYAVYDALGYGFLEVVYARALLLELQARGLQAEREVPLTVRYRGLVVGAFRADLLVESRIILEIKASPQLTIPDRNQLLNYLTASEIELGLLLNFGPRPSFHRVISTKQQGDARPVNAPTSSFPAPHYAE